MDKRVINNFAVTARRELIQEVSLKLGSIGITDQGVDDKLPSSLNEAEFYRSSKAPLVGKDIQRRRQIVSKLQKKSISVGWKSAFDELVEQTAYTWFNRIIAIRFLEVNDYLPSGVRVLSSIEGHVEPDIMVEAKSLEPYLGKYAENEQNLIDQAWKNQEPEDMDRLYQMLFIKQINALEKNLPKLFVNTDDYMQLLFVPSYHKGVIKELIDDLPEKDFDVTSGGQVEVVGWLYQYYNQGPKELAFKKKKYAQTDIPSVTQLFTPDWIVKYLVENSLGRYWIDHLIAKGDSRDANKIADDFGWHYFMADASQPDEVQIKLKEINASLKNIEVTQIKFIDPASGSGHILVYAFDIFMQLYKTEGYTQRQAARLILKNNLYGADSDARAFQLTYFSLMMKARQYDRHILNLDQQINVVDIPQFKWQEEDLKLLAGNISDATILVQLKEIVDQFRYGDELGSLISLNSNHLDYSKILDEIISTQSQKQLSLEDIHREVLIEQLKHAIHALKILGNGYNIAVTNPPYMGSGKMPKPLANFVKKNYPTSKADLFAVFMEKLNQLTISGGYYAMVTQHQWMFLLSFEKLRTLLRQKTIVNLAHLGTRAFEEIGGEVVQSVAFVFRNQKIADFVGNYERLVSFDSQEKKEKAYLKAVSNPNVSYVYRTNQTNFEKIPGSPIGYWLPKSLFLIFQNYPKFGDLYTTRAGMITGNNQFFMRRWPEVNIKRISFNSSSREAAMLSHCVWFPYSKGGDYRRWYGNLDFIVNWENDGIKIRNMKDANNHIPAHAFNLKYIFKTQITWSSLSSKTFSARIAPQGMLFDASGSFSSVSKENRLRILAFLNSNVCTYLLEAINPTLNFQKGNISALPLIDSDKYETKILSKLCVQLSKTDWDAFETSWDFKTHVLLRHIAEHHRNWTLKEAFNQWADEAQQRFEKLKSNEEELNRIFIDLYGLQDELKPEVADENASKNADKVISIRRADRERDIKSFLSYFIGVTFGRYSLDVPGLAFAGGTWEDSKYQTYKPNKDDIIVLTDEDYFGDNRDIIHRLKEFLTVTFGETHLEENMRYIAESLGKRGEEPEAQIRQYFLDDFYKKDHLSTYKKRPIYWELSSGKQNGFKALIYLHRYDDNTMAMTRTSYLHPLQDAYASERERLQHMMEIEKNTAEKNQLRKRLEKVTKQFDEIVKYDAKLQHVANMHIAIDLDDGVMANHQKVQADEKLLAPLK